MSRIKAFALIAMFAWASAAHAEDSAWTVAAESFSGSGIPKIYESFTTTIPTLILSRISTITSRNVDVGEKRARVTWSASAKRIQLVQERSKLILERDKLLLSPADEEDKKKLLKTADEGIATKTKEIRTLDDEAKKKKGGEPPKAELIDLKLWESGESLYTRKKETSLAKALEDDKISCLISGTIEDISGYMYVTVNLETGIPGLPAFSASEAAPYDEVDGLVDVLTARIIPELAKLGPVSIVFSVEPKDARIFVDGRVLKSGEDTVRTLAGKHVISVDSAGYRTAMREYSFEKARAFKVSIALEKIETVDVSFDTRGNPASLFVGTTYYGETPAAITIPKLDLVGSVKSGDVTSWFVFRPRTSLAHGENLVVRMDKVDAKKRIDNQRTIMYWSLGALYLSLPVSMLSYGICMDMYYAAVDKKTYLGSDYLKMADIAEYSKYVSIACGVNFAIQLVFYILAADQVMPQTIH